LKEEEAWNFIRPVCRELDELVNLRKVKSYLAFIVKEKVHMIYLKCSKIHLSSRGIFDTIGDIEYQNNKLRIGFSSNKIPLNLIIYMTNT
jgi:hypothetical protein